MKQMFDNDDRKRKLQALVDAGATSDFTRLVYEWVKTGVFTVRDLNTAMHMMWSKGHDEGQGNNNP